MRKQLDKNEVRQFYSKWAPHAMLFCRLYTGDIEAAETAVAQTFLKYFRAEPRLPLDHVPVTLMTLAVEESSCSGAERGSGVDSDFERAILDLPPDERIIFILHGALGLQLSQVGAITQRTFDVVSQLWIRALLQLRMSTVKNSVQTATSTHAMEPIGSA